MLVRGAGENRNDCGMELGLTQVVGREHVREIKSDGEVSYEPHFLLIFVMK
jgi:hypothetical protein